MNLNKINFNAQSNKTNLNIANYTNLNTNNEMNLNASFLDYEELDYGDSNNNSSVYLEASNENNANLNGAVNDIKEAMQEIYNSMKVALYSLSLFSYKTFLNCLIADKFVEKYFVDSRYIYQGCCEVGNLCLSTAYDSGIDKNSPFKMKRGNSVLEISDFNGNKKVLNLDNNSHVGGIAYDETNKKIFISGDGAVNIYDTDDILNSSNGSEINKYKTYKLNIDVDGIDAASYLTSCDGNLFVGQFDKENSTKLAKYSIDANGNLTLTKQYDIPYKKVQGMCITKYMGKEYYFFSCSYGRDSESTLIVSELNNGSFETVKKIPMPPMLEQISVTNDGTIMTIFESGCAKYNGADGNGQSNEQINDICYLDVGKLIDA